MPEHIKETSNSEGRRRRLVKTFVLMIIFVAVSSALWSKVEEVSIDATNKYLLSKDNPAKDVYFKAAKLSIEERASQISQEELSRVTLAIDATDAMKKIVKFAGYMLQLLLTITFTFLIDFSSITARSKINE